MPLGGGAGANEAHALPEGESASERAWNMLKSMVNTTMIATYSDSALAPHLSFGSAELKAVFIEPFLVVGAALFWIGALPFVAVSLMGLKVWETLVALTSGKAVRPNPLILRRSVASNISGRSSAETAKV
jgi:hypothetical protein